MNKRTLMVRELELTPQQQEERRIKLLAAHLRAQFPRLNRKRMLENADDDPLAPARDADTELSDALNGIHVEASDTKQTSFRSTVQSELNKERSMIESHE